MSEPGLYVHVPFCRSRCLYCGFASSTDQSSRGRFLDALALEATRAGAWGAFDSLYVGGGTPSVLTVAEIDRLFERVCGALPVDARAEITLEANPDDVDDQRLAAWRGVGVNRLSLGLQSLDDGVLRLLGRRHDARGAIEAVNRARAAGFDNLGLDLIFGLPGQELASWRATLSRTLELEPEHLSCYSLTLEPDTPFERRVARGELDPADEAAERALLIETHEVLTSAGFDHYEVSNYARGPRSRHNQKYWRHAPYLGLGPAAHSFDGRRRRWWNPRELVPWAAALEGGVASARAGEERLTAEQLELEAVMLGLRTSDGVPRAVLRRTAARRAALAELIDQGLLVEDGHRVAPTLEGLLLADGLPLRLL